MGIERPSWELLNKVCMYVCMYVLQDLTDFNTAHNKRLSSIAIEEGGATLPKLKRRRVSQNVSFKEGHEIINPGKTLLCPLLYELL